MSMMNEVVMGELGWSSLSGRRKMLRLNIWRKIIEMKEDRLVKRVHRKSRNMFVSGKLKNSWCRLTEKWLKSFGLNSV